MRNLCVLIEPQGKLRPLVEGEFFGTGFGVEGEVGEDLGERRLIYEGGEGVGEYFAFL